MTRDDVQKIIEDLGFQYYGPFAGYEGLSLADFCEFAKAVAEIEREECAIECEKWSQTVGSFKPRFWDLKIKAVIVGHKAASKMIAAAIRARSHDEQV